VSDPRELQNLARKHDARTGDFRREVAAWLRDQNERQRGPVSAPPNRELLRSLGYVD
jgi:hypothetical protein